MPGPPGQVAHGPVTHPSGLTLILRRDRHSANVAQMHTEPPLALTHLVKS